MGILRILGQIDLQQFWPDGESDADTTKIKLKIGAGAFGYKAEGKKRFATTGVFHDAISKGKVRKPVVQTRAADQSKSVTIRLQGIDAPELHYRAAALRHNSQITDAMREAFNQLNKERRQHFAESATVALARFLGGFARSNGMIPAVFTTRVDFPNEAVDTYGRFVGNISVGVDSDINTWLAGQGWCFPAFYTSMLPDEINNILMAWKKGKGRNGRTGRSYSRNAGNFDWDLLYRKGLEGSVFQNGEDKGPVLMPKLYRRQVAWMLQRKAGAIPRNMTFTDFLSAIRDELRLLQDFLDNGRDSARTYFLHELVSPQHKMTRRSEEIIFQEFPSTLVDAQGRKITQW